MKAKFFQLFLIVAFSATFTSCMVPYRVHEQRRVPRERHYGYDRHHHHGRY